MAAVIDIHTGSNIAESFGGESFGGLAVPASGDSFGGGPAARRGAPLRVIHGGRSQAGRQLRRTFLRRRVLAAVALVVVVFCALQVAGAAVSAFSVQGAASAPLTGDTYQVAPGDTLWAIAGRLAPESDPRDVVQQLVELNPGAVSSQGVLHAGEVLVLPQG